MSSDYEQQLYAFLGLDEDGVAGPDVISDENVLPLRTGVQSATGYLLGQLGSDETNPDTSSSPEGASSKEILDRLVSRCLIENSASLRAAIDQRMAHARLASLTAAALANGSRGIFVKLFKSPIKPDEVDVSLIVRLVVVKFLVSSFPDQPIADLARDPSSPVAQVIDDAVKLLTQ